MIVRLLHGDCVARMHLMLEASVGWILCDPPYGLEFMGKEWDRLDGVGTGGATFSTDGMGKGFRALPSYSGNPNPLCRDCKGSQRGRDQVGFKVCRCSTPEFPNTRKEQGIGMQEWHTRWLKEAFRVLQPGGQAMAFGGTRTFHRLGAAMADVGFTNIHHEAWNYANGFPKSLNVGKSFDRRAGELAPENTRFSVAGVVPGQVMQGTAPSRGYVPPVPVTLEAVTWDGWGTALKPAWEPVLVGVKP